MLFLRERNREQLIICQCFVLNETLLYLEHKISSVCTETNQVKILVNLKSMYFGIENKNKKHNIYFVNTILYIVKWELWTIRNLMKY